MRISALTKIKERKNWYKIMRYLKQFGIILAVTCAGEVMKYFIPLPVPASIYGLLLMMILLLTKRIKLEQLRETADFLVEIMPVMFIPAAAGLLDSWGQMKAILFPITVITIVSTVIVIFVTGKVTEFMINRREKRRE